MEMHYCDLCNQPLKNERHIICIVDDKNFRTESNNKYRNPPSNVNYEVCPSCIEQLHKIFTMKKNKIKEVIQHLEDIYSLPTKNSRRKKK